MLLHFPMLGGQKGYNPTYIEGCKRPISNDSISFANSSADDRCGLIGINLRDYEAPAVATTQEGINRYRRALASSDSVLTPLGFLGLGFAFRQSRRKVSFA